MHGMGGNVRGNYRPVSVPGWPCDLHLWGIMARYGNLWQSWGARSQCPLIFEEPLIVEAATTAGSDRLLTKDLNDGQTIRDVQIVNPFRPLAELQPR